MCSSQCVARWFCAPFLCSQANTLSLRELQFDFVKTQTHATAATGEKCNHLFDTLTTFKKCVEEAASKQDDNLAEIRSSFAAIKGKFYRSCGQTNSVVGVDSRTHARTHAHADTCTRIITHTLSLTRMQHQTQSLVRKRQSWRTTSTTFKNTSSRHRKRPTTRCFRSRRSLKRKTTSWSQRRPRWTRPKVRCFNKAPGCLLCFNPAHLLPT